MRSNVLFLKPKLEVLQIREAYSKGYDTLLEHSYLVKVYALLRTDHLREYEAVSSVLVVPNTVKTSDGICSVGNNLS